MRNSPSGKNTGTAKKTIFALSLFAAILLILITIFPAYPFRLIMRHTEAFVPVGHAISEEYHFKNLIRDQYSAADIQRRILNNAWAASHIRGDLGLSLVNCAAFFKRPAVLRMLLSMHAPVNGLAGVEYGDTTLETTPLNTAVTGEHPDLKIIKILLAAGADPYQTFSDGGSTPSSALGAALTSQDSEIVKIFKALKRPGVRPVANTAATRPADEGNATPGSTGQ